MAGGEDQAQQVVADVVVEGRIEIRCSLLLHLELAAELLLLALQALAAADQVDSPVLGRAHEPGARPVRDA